MTEQDERPTGEVAIMLPPVRTVAPFADFPPDVPPVPHIACPNLSAALAQARDRCRMAHKDKRNDFHKFNYASADEVITVAKEALADSGLAVIPQLQELTALGAGNAALYALNRTVFLSHKSGEYVPLSIRGWPVIPERGRPLDKAFAVALTSSLAYLLRDLLQMPRGDEHDMNTRDDRDAPVHRPQPAPAKSAPAPAPKEEPAVQVPELMKLLSDAGKSWHDVREPFGERIDKELGNAMLDDLTPDERKRLKSMLAATIAAKRAKTEQEKANLAAAEGLFEDHQKRPNVGAMR